MPEPERITVVRDADWIIGWDAARAAHVYREGGDVAFGRGGLVQVGGRYDGPASREIPGRGRMVMPGLVNIHSHPGDEALVKGVFDDVGAPALWGNALYSVSGLIEPDADGLRACATVTLCEQLLSGVTTLVDLSAAWEGWIGLLAESGLRAYAAPMFRQACWRVEDGCRLDYDWDDAAGCDAFAAALETVDAARAHSCGRLGGVVAPAQIDTCRAGLLQAAHAAAVARDVPFQIHAAQLMAEHDELMRRYGLTAPQWMDRLGILSGRVTLGHGIFLDHHSWTRPRTGHDLPLLARRGVSVAHCPLAFARSGMTLESLGRYRGAGVNVGIGTDSYPNNMLEEMRLALLCARIAGRTFEDTDTAAIFSAATLGGARALGRSDIGRLAPGAKADLVLVDLTHKAMRPVYDPLRSLLHGACERAVDTVFVDGTACVEGGRVTTLDHAGASAALQAAMTRAVAAVPGRPNAAGRSLRDIAPLSLPTG